MSGLTILYPPSIINHPHFFAVYADGSICLDILQNRWSPTYDVSSILTSIQVTLIQFSKCKVISTCDDFERNCDPLTCLVVYSVFTGWAKPKQSSQQPSSPAVPRKQAGVREEGFCHCWTELARLLTPAIVQVRTMSTSESRNHRSRTQLITQKWHILKFFYSVYLSHNCC